MLMSARTLDGQFSPTFGLPTCREMHSHQDEQKSALTHTCTSITVKEEMGRAILAQPENSVLPSGVNLHRRVTCDKVDNKVL